MPEFNVYLITNLINGKVYVGRTKRTLLARWRGHIRKAFSKNPLDGGVSYIAFAIKKYGPENFKIELLESCISENEMKEKESQYIIKYNSIDENIGYNLILEDYRNKKTIFRYDIAKTRKAASHNKENPRISKYGSGIYLRRSKYRISWEARISYDGEMYTKNFPTQEEAIVFRDKMAVIFYKEDADLINEKHKELFCEEDLEQIKKELVAYKNRKRYIGVEKQKDKDGKRKFNAYVIINRKRIHLGVFSDEESAALCHDRASWAIAKNLDLLNFPQKTSEFGCESFDEIKDSCLTGRRLEEKYSKYTGVSFNNQTKKWTVYYKHKYYRSFDNEESAAVYFDKFEYFFNKNTLRLNFPENIELYKNSTKETQAEIDRMEAPKRLNIQNTSGFFNVGLNDCKKWGYRIKLNKKTYAKFVFDSKERAALERDLVFISHKGVAGPDKLNFPIASIFSFIGQNLEKEACHVSQ